MVWQNRRKCTLYCLCHCEYLLRQFRSVVETATRKNCQIVENIHRQMCKPLHIQEGRRHHRSIDHTLPSMFLAWWLHHLSNLCPFLYWRRLTWWGGGGGGGGRRWRGGGVGVRRSRRWGGRGGGGGGRSRRWGWGWRWWGGWVYTRIEGGGGGGGGRWLYTRLEGANIPWENVYTMRKCVVVLVATERGWDELLYWYLPQANCVPAQIS